jgi:hypothetical protein
MVPGKPAETLAVGRYQDLVAILLSCGARRWFFFGGCRSFRLSALPLRSVFHRSGSPAIGKNYYTYIGWGTVSAVKGGPFQRSGGTVSAWKTRTIHRVIHTSGKGAIQGRGTVSAVVRGFGLLDDCRPTRFQDKTASDLLELEAGVNNGDLAQGSFGFLFKILRGGIVAAELRL